jgi:hypothetical protein
MLVMLLSTNAQCNYHLTPKIWQLFSDQFPAFNRFLGA